MVVNLIYSKVGFQPWEIILRHSLYCKCHLTRDDEGPGSKNFSHWNSRYSASLMWDRDIKAEMARTIPRIILLSLPDIPLPTTLNPSPTLVECGFDCFSFLVFYACERPRGLQSHQQTKKETG